MSEFLDSLNKNSGALSAVFSGVETAATIFYLEGTGKGRRHVKLMSVSQIKDKKLAQYLSLALHATKQDDL
jgi:hypothetical protein